MSFSINIFLHIQSRAKDVLWSSCIRKGCLFVLSGSRIEQHVGLPCSPGCLCCSPSLGGCFCQPHWTHTAELCLTLLPTLLLPSRHPRRLWDVNKLLPGKVVLTGEIIYELPLNILWPLLFLPSSSLYVQSTAGHTKFFLFLLWI